MAHDQSEQAVEQRAREVIQDLTHGLVGSGTVRDISDAAHKAARDRTAGKALNPGVFKPSSGRPFGL